ncbi:serine hydrolase FSH [Kipferlia bialata]|uniref:Serine hydrolase FSH n=1 Tax=Kipferlia bialata TaxID=797122 RepID=A0A9K3D6A7_9EUKA|nr:serine hydrolase FSH [Kipferlia bialata]|eukprot:g10260.t1
MFSCIWKYLKHTSTIEVFDAPVSLSPADSMDSDGYTVCTTRCIGAEGSIDVRQTLIQPSAEPVSLLGWWAWDKATDERHYIEESLDYTERHILESQPDVLLGFSQGASALGLLLRRWGDSPPSFLKLAVLVAPPGLPGCEDTPKVKSPLPVHMVYGTSDSILSEELILSTADHLHIDKIHTHTGGHFIPAAKAHRPMWAEE